MAIPIIMAVTPAIGHSGGRTLVEISGTNFRLPAAPAAAFPRGPNVPLPEPAPSVAVSFGGVAAVKVWAVSTTLLRVLTPIHEPAGGNALDELGDLIPAADVVVQNLDDDGVAIAGEVATLAAAYTFARPNLGTPGFTQRVIEEFVRQLRIQLLDNVKLNPSTDFDPDSGDAQNFCEFASLPGVAIVDIRLPKSATAAQHEQTVEAVDEETWIARRPPMVRDIVLTMIGASDNTGELLTLEEALEAYFRKNGKLRVLRDPDAPERGELAFSMIYTPNLESVTFTGRIGNTNVQAFTATAVIQSVPRTDMPGVSTTSIAAAPAGWPAEATQEVGKTADTIQVERVRK